MKKFRYFFSIMVFFSISQFSYANKILVIDIDEGIGPATTSYIGSNIDKAVEENFTALIIRLDTPGGLLDATRDIVESILEAKVPVIVYVAPGGARAGSAGVFITLSAHIAAMAPGTNIGAAHPVGMGGESDTTVMFQKVTNDASAFVRTIAQERGRNEEWAERAVRESISSTANEALESGAIDLITSNINTLLQSIDSMEVETKGGTVTLLTANAEVEYKEKNWKEEILTLISNPNIAYIFLMIGFYGIIFELYSPGSIFPGVIGAISILLGAYSMQMLPINSVGIGLIAVSFILFIIEIYVVSYGLLTIGGIVSFVIGSIMLIDSPYEFMEISMSLIITVAVLTALFFIWIISSGIRAQFHKRSIGGSNIKGETGKAKTDIIPGDSGSVYVHGEFWKAVSMETIKEGDTVKVTGIDGFTLIVKKISK